MGNVKKPMTPDVMKNYLRSLRNMVSKSFRLIILINGINRPDILFPYDFG